MNSYIKNKLAQCKVAQLPAGWESHNYIFIPKTLQIESKNVLENHCYLIELEDYLLNPPPNFTLSTNWNGGSNPKSKWYKCEISKVMGKMIKITGLEYDNVNQVDLDRVWEGWLPAGGIKVLKEI